MEETTGLQRLDLTGIAADPHAVYSRMREAGPVHRVAGPDGTPVWLITRHQDAKEALADPRLSLDKAHAPAGYAGFTLPAALDRNLLNMDPPDHTRIRRLVGQAFTARRVEELRPRVRQAADELLDGVKGEEADLIPHFTRPLPTIVICELLGVPAEDRPDFHRWTDAMLMPDRTRPDALRQAVKDLWVFFAALIARKRTSPDDDLLSGLVAAQEADDVLSDDELTSLAFLLLTAGVENTTHMIGNSVVALLQHPEQLRALLADGPDIAPTALDELARYESPAPVSIRRFTREQVTVGGVTIPAGETVLVAIASANRDPARFPSPDVLDLDRGSATGLTFGQGIHYCLGAPLARMETGTALSVLLRRFPDVALSVPASDLRWRPSPRSRGLLSLPVRLRPNVGGS
jgi:cytochrome P450